MKKLGTLLFVSLSLLMQASVFAQESKGVGVDVELEPATPVQILYPTANLQRPFTMLEGTFETSLNLQAGTNTGIDDHVALDSLSIRYGITNDFEMGLRWGGVAFQTMTPKKSLDVTFGTFLFAIPGVAAGMASLDIPLEFTQLGFKPNVGFFTSVSLIPNKLALGLLYDLIEVDFGNGKTNWSDVKTTIKFPIALGWQATDRVWLKVDTVLAKSELSGNAITHSHLVNKTPAHISTLVGINHMFDFVARTGFDNVQSPKDSFSFVAGLNYRFGQFGG